MHLAGRRELLSKFQRACCSINNDGNGCTQSISITQTILNARKTVFQIFNHVPNGRTLHKKRALSVGEIAQQGWNPNDWQTIILFYRTPGAR
jgi:hypothetical protein